MSGDLTQLSAIELARLISERKVSPVEVIEAYLKKIESVNPALNAIVTLAADAVDRAKEAETKIMNGDDVGLLHGVPVTIKDTIDTKNLRTTSGSKRLAAHIPDEDAAVVSLLKEAGAIIIGKTNTAEMAMSYECDNPLFGRTNNPHNLTKTSGGSSGGDAAAVAAKMTPIGIGSDLMGSVRVPAHFCGIYGLKPTMGRISMHGHFPKAEGIYSLGAVIGTLARYVEDLELAFKVIANSPSSKFHVPCSKLESKIRTPHSALRTRKVCFYTGDGVTPVTSETKEAILKAAKLFSDAGFIVEEKLPPYVERGGELWRRLFMRGGLQTLEELYGGHEEDTGEIVRAILKYKDKNEQRLDDFLGAWTERDRARDELIEWMKDYPFIIAPVGSIAAFEHGARRVDVEGQTLNLMQAFSYCQTWNVFGFPSLSIPVYKTKEGLPIGVQIICAPFSESDLFEAAAIL